VKKNRSLRDGAAGQGRGAVWNISLTVSPIRDSTGRIIGHRRWHATSRIGKKTEAILAAQRQQLEQSVEERTRELTKAHEHLRLSDRMASVGTLAAGLAHDMKNVLLPLGGRLDAILTSPGLSREASTDIAVVCALLDHLRAMATNLSLFARDPQQEGTEGRTEPGRWCEQVRGFIDASAGLAVRVKWDVPDGLPAVGIAPHRLTSGHLELVHNARDAIAAVRGPLTGTPACGCISVEARLVGASEAVASGTGAPGEGGARVVISVRDDGCGMSEEVRRHCVEPFFTTKDRPTVPGAPGGSGLGLSMAHAIVERVGGTLEIESACGEGTTVTLNLPVATPDGPGGRSGAGRACVSIEDKRTRAIVGHVLEGLHYELLEGAPGAIPNGGADWVLWVCRRP